MKTVSLIAALLIVPISASCQEVTADYNAGYCAGWQQATAIEQQRFMNWRNSFIGPAKPSSAFGFALSSISESLPTLVLLPSITGKFTLDDGRVIDCTPAPAKPEK